MRIEYQSIGGHVPFKSEIESFLARQPVLNPVSATAGAGAASGETLTNTITEIFLGTRHTRLAGLPNAESINMMREIVRGAIERNAPIPVLVGSGPKKNRCGQIDLAELAALRQLCCIQAAVCEHYAPGFAIRIRLEDATGFFLEGTEPPIVGDMQEYCCSFKMLCRMLNHSAGQDFLLPYCESEHCNLGEFLETATSFVPTFVQSYESGNNGYVERIGWSNGVSEAWKDYLRGRYSRIYPDFTDGDITNMSCRYLSTTLARFKMGLTRGRNIESWAINGKNLELSFALPAPGAPAVSPRVFYRTVSAKQTKLHVPFWRAKGYLRVVEGEVKLGLSQGTQENNAYVPGFVEIEDSSSRRLQGKHSLPATSRLRIAADFLSSN